MSKVATLSSFDTPRNNGPAVFYLLLALILTFIYSVYFINGWWAGDFWHHCAIIEELKRAPFSPSDPFSLDIPHEKVLIPYWPYLVLMAVASNIFNVTAYDALALAGYLNLLLFLYSFRILVGFFSHERSAPSFALLLTLLAWGSGAWWFSGFYNLPSFFAVMPYPSTFAFSVAILAIAAYNKSLEENDVVFILTGCALSTLTFLTHPISFLFLASSILAIRDKGSRLRERLPLIAAFILVPVIVGYFWPYFPLSELSSSARFSADPNAKQMYLHVFERIYPALVGLPLLLFWVNNRYDESKSIAHPVRLLAILTAIYVYGWYVQRWNFGRVISYWVLVLHIVEAHYLALYLRNLSSRTEKLYKNALFIAAGCALLLALNNTATTLYKTINLAKYQGKIYRDLQFIRKLVPSDSAVLTDLLTSKVLVAHGNRVIATDIPPFFEDYDNRVKDIGGSADSELTMKSIIKNYGVAYVLVTERFKPAGTALTNLSHIASNASYHLYKVN